MFERAITVVENADTIPKLRLLKAGISHIFIRCLDPIPLGRANGRELADTLDRLVEDLPSSRSNVLAILVNWVVPRVCWACIPRLPQTSPLF